MDWLSALCICKIKFLSALSSGELFMEVWREMEMEAILSDVEEAIGSEVGLGERRFHRPSQYLPPPCLTAMMDRSGLLEKQIQV